MDRFGQSGKPDDLFKEYGLDAASIYQQARAYVQETR
jgi:transketolase C-terminal domain/subunit